MPSFRDSNGREWLVRLDGPKIRDVRKECDIDLCAIDGSVYERLENDPCLLVDVLWVVCRNQANGVTATQFGEALVGDQIESAAAALIEAVTDFFPTRKRSLLRSLATKQAAVMDKGLELAIAKLNDPTLEANLLQAMESKMSRELASLMIGLNGATTQPDIAESIRPA